MLPRAGSQPRSFGHSQNVPAFEPNAEHTLPAVLVCEACRNAARTHPARARSLPSTEPAVARRKTSTGRVCPMRWHLSMACAWCEQSAAEHMLPQRTGKGH